MSDCEHKNLEVTEDAEGNLDEARLTRYFTDYRCPDCGYYAEVPPKGWEPMFDGTDEE